MIVKLRLNGVGITVWGQVRKLVLVQIYFLQEPVVKRIFCGLRRALDRMDKVRTSE
jgi:hypothetical protein